MRPGQFFGYLALAGLALLWAGALRDSHNTRYRVTVEIETPEGVRTGSSVVEVRWEVAWLRIAHSLPHQVYVRGEATFVDLGAGRNVIALLAGGRNAEGVDWSIDVWQAFLAARVARRVEDIWEKLSPARASIALEGHWRPTLVTFADPADPRSARQLVDDGDMERAFGPGVRVSRITLAYVDPGLRLLHGWPQKRLLSLAKPRWLFGEPVTQGIEQRLPELLPKLDQLNKGPMSERMNAPFWIRFGHLKIR